MGNKDIYQTDFPEKGKSEIIEELIKLAEEVLKEDFDNKNFVVKSDNKKNNFYFESLYNNYDNELRNNKEYKYQSKFRKELDKELVKFKTISENKEELQKKIIEISTEHFKSTKDLDLRDRKFLFFLISTLCIIMFCILIFLVLYAAFSKTIIIENCSFSYTIKDYFCSTTIQEKFNNVELISSFITILSGILGTLFIVYKYAFNKENDILLQNIIALYEKISIELESYRNDKLKNQK